MKVPITYFFSYFSFIYFFYPNSIRYKHSTMFKIKCLICFLFSSKRKWTEWKTNNFFKLLYISIWFRLNKLFIVVYMLFILFRWNQIDIYMGSKKIIHIHDQWRIKIHFVKCERRKFLFSEMWKTKKFICKMWEIMNRIM